MSPEAGPEPDSGPDLVCVGAATVDRTYEVTNLPEPDGGAFAHSVSDSYGGVGANVATGLARLGRETGLLARLGEDEFADRVEADLDPGPVRTDLVRRGPGTTTHCIIPRGPTGERMIITAGDSTKRLRLDEADRETVHAAEAVFATAYLPDRVTRDLVEIAGAEDAPAFVFDLSGPLEELTNRGTERETIDRAVRAADLFIVGEVAAESYLDRPATAAVDALRERGCTRGAVTFGEDGATLFDADSTTAIDAFEVDTVDATGAGDAFVAALTDRWLLAGEAPEPAGRFAAAAAALNCRAEGARGGLVDAEAVRAFLAERG
ncbi:MAG: carbohydrate kinase family protein [Halolamina sp.]